MIDVVDINILH